MASIYSALMFQGHDMADEELVYLDPAYLWIMRDIDCFLPGPAVDAGLSVVDAVSNGTIAQFQSLTVVPAGMTFEWRGRQVFQPPTVGATLVIRSSSPGGGADCRISGYKLTPP